MYLINYHIFEVVNDALHFDGFDGFINNVCRIESDLLMENQSMYQVQIPISLIIEAIILPY